MSATDNGQPILAVQLQPPQELFPEAQGVSAMGVVVAMLACYKLQVAVSPEEGVQTQDKTVIRE